MTLALAEAELKSARSRITELEETLLGKQVSSRCAQMWSTRWFCHFVSDPRSCNFSTFFWTGCRGQSYWRKWPAEVRTRFRWRNWGELILFAVFQTKLHIKRWRDYFAFRCLTFLAWTLAHIVCDQLRAFCFQKVMEIGALSGKEDEYQRTIEIFQSKVSWKRLYSHLFWLCVSMFSFFFFSSHPDGMLLELFCPDWWIGGRFETARWHDQTVVRQLEVDDWEPWSAAEWIFCAGATTRHSSTHAPASAASGRCLLQMRNFSRTVALLCSMQSFLSSMWCYSDLEFCRLENTWEIKLVNMEFQLRLYLRPRMNC